MRRRLLQLLCCISASVAIATAAIWVHSLFAHATLAFVRVDRPGAHLVGRLRNVEWYAGKVGIYWSDATLLNEQAYEIYVAKEGRGWCANFSAGPHDDPDTAAYFALFGPSFLGGRFERTFRNHPDMTGPQLIVWIPCWWILLVTVPLPALLVFRRVRVRRRLRAGLCAACGYDVRATPDRCPECGAVLSRAPHNPPMQRTATAACGAVE